MSPGSLPATFIALMAAAFSGFTLVVSGPAQGPIALPVPSGLDKIDDESLALADQFLAALSESVAAT